MLRLKEAMGACILVSTLVSAVVAHAAAYYVATNGSDSNPGTSTKPWRTVAYATSKMVAGDTTYVKSGTYIEGLIRFRTSGTASAPIKLLNFPGESPVIEFKDGGELLPPPPYHRPRNAYMILLQSSAGNNKPIGWITIEGFEIRNGYNNIKWYNGHNLTIRHNWIHDSFPASAILGIGGLDNLIERNTFNHNAFLIENVGGHIGGYAIYANGSRYTIVNNVFYDSAGYHIQHNGSASSLYDPTKFASNSFAESVDWLVANNVFAYSYYKTAYVIWGARTSGLRIENNIFYENCVTCPIYDPQGIMFQSPGAVSRVAIRNNLAYATGSGGRTFLLTGGAVEGSNYTQSGNIVNSADPAFVNAPATLPGSPNFALTSRSPAIDKGVLLDATKIAFDGMPRPQGRAYDIGAYEYATDGDTQEPRAPTELRAQ